MGATTDNAVHVTVDVVLVAQIDDQPHVLLIRRGGEPFEDKRALPGGYVDEGEQIEDAARRELAEETGLTAPDVWHRVGIYDAPGRDPRGRVISVAYAAVLPAAFAPVAGDDAREAHWVPLADAAASGLAFDHADILSDARAHIGL